MLQSLPEGRLHAGTQIFPALRHAYPGRKPETRSERGGIAGNRDPEGPGAVGQLGEQILNESRVEIGSDLIAQSTREPCLYPAHLWQARKNNDQCLGILRHLADPSTSRRTTLEARPESRTDFPGAASAVKARRMFTTADFKRHLRILIDGDPYTILDVAMQSPSARGASSISKIKVRNLRTGQVLEKSYRGGDKVQEANLDFRGVQFLYSDGTEYHFMDTESYDQFALTGDALGTATGFLKEGLAGIRSMVMGDEVLGVDLPNTVTLQVTETAPAIKGATAQAQTKPATLETGLEIQVPAYLENDELVQVDTRDSRFVSRVKD